MITIVVSQEAKDQHRRCREQRGDLQKGKTYPFHPALTTKAIGPDLTEGIIELTVTRAEYVGEEKNGNGSVFETRIRGIRFCFIMQMGSNRARIADLPTKGKPSPAVQELSMERSKSPPAFRRRWRWEGKQA